MAHLPLPAWAGDASKQLQRRIDSLSGQISDVKSQFSDEDARAGAMAEHLRQLALLLRSCQSQAQAHQAELDTEQQLQRIVQQNEVIYLGFHSESSSACGMCSFRGLRNAACLM